MALTNKDRLTRAMDALTEGLQPFVERELKAAWGANWEARLDQSRPKPMERDRSGTLQWDAHSLLNAIIHNFREVFSNQLGHAERNYAGELLTVRNEAWAHGNKPVSSEDTIRALDTAERLLVAVGAMQKAEELKQLRIETQRTVYAEETRQQTRRKTLSLEGSPKAGLKPWREVVTPHRDVASGRYVQAEFAADLAQVHRGEGADEYRDPVEFYRRTYLTQGLRGLLESAMYRLSYQGGDPVVELQTNFGGGKTHSMLGLYHLFGADDVTRLPGVEELMTEFGIEKLPRGNRAVLVGTDLSPAEPQTKPDGTVTHTLWGEMAWQLGGKAGYDRVAESDQRAISPGSGILSELLKAHAPCLVLIDEWVAYVRQLYHINDLPAGTFDSNLTFAQALTEAAKAVPGAMLVASLPASQIEIGGEGGQQALERLKNTFSRIESAWQPATADEGFEIVRRRLFEPIAEREDYAARDAVIKAFIDMYKRGGNEFPQGCGEGDYRRRMEAAYPIHPELFERLYNDWGGLDKFQRTRGVLRLMAATIHVLWERNDPNLIILPASIPIDDSSVQSELTRYLEQSWSAVIAKDVDGSSSIPLTIDQEVPTLGRYSATRRVARTVYIGSAPTYQSNNPGIDDRRIRLGCAQPGESPSTFGDALRRLVDRATYLYQDGTRYWYSTQPSVARMADDRAAQYEDADVDGRIVERLRKEKTRGEFHGVHVAPDGSADVPDEMEARLVILGPEYPYAKNDGNRAREAAEQILKTRGSAQRMYRNMLVFVAPDSARLTELRDSMRLLMAWTSIVAENEALNLDAFQRRQAESKKADLERSVDTRIHETWIWSLVPWQDAGQSEIHWESARLQGQDSLPVRMAKRLITNEGLFTRYGPARLGMVLEEFFWPQHEHINTRQLWEHLASYLYLPRLKGQDVLQQTIEAGIGELFAEHFAYAGRYNEETGRYEGLNVGGGGQAVIDGFSVLIKPDVAKTQRDLEDRSNLQEDPNPYDAVDREPATQDNTESSDAPGAPRKRLVKRFYGTVALDPDRAPRDMGKVAEEVLQHLTVLPRAQVEVTVEITATIPEGVDDDTQRVVTENCEVLSFKSQGFEES
ncbi:Swt1 family HEPN domain-containing protein [Aquisalimonas asiatica]|uniref:Swt1-like HEPN domain-containing protein n=1 Tax=Aquisalimonas asiatica TaxID=406100 RepID=A0A1H8T2M8_9GAMM|nr:Swt1 family HEPN domain-containing protein [Aquisalimonas asiatica]SEO85319.1 hypothetical protein SAMN04488052_103384 [Aquisalimonas asiatica]